METEKSVLVLVPGMFSTGNVFEKMKERLEELGKKCKIIDFPRFEDSEDCLICEYSFSEKINFVVNFLEKLEKPFELGGHSAGATMVLKIASFPQINPLRIFLFAPAPTYGVFSLYPSVIKSFWFVIRDPYFMTKNIKIPFKCFKKGMAQTLPNELARSIFEKLRIESGKFIFEVGLWIFDSNKATLIDYLEIQCPAKIFIGSKDRVTPVGVAKRICKILKRNRLWQVEFIKINGCSHWLIEEALDEICESCL
jgi:pimeloyl-ACP methyl ester carboxylesterase